jgi:hypothetical protein
MIGLFIFWLIFASHIAIMFTIVNGQCNAFGTYLTAFGIYIAIVVGLFPPIVSGVFGYLTYWNILRVRVRVMKVTW